MGSVKHLIVDASKREESAYKMAARLYRAPTRKDFGRGVWYVAGTSSVGDLKEVIPPQEIDIKGPALTMMTALFFERLAELNPEIPQCYHRVLDKDGNEVRAQDLLAKGDTTNLIVMKLAHTPQSYSNGNLDLYREAINPQFGELKCAVADVESIFRNGFPLGSSTFNKIFAAVGMTEEYSSLARHGETVEALEQIRTLVDKKGLDNLPKLKKVLQRYGLGTTIPNPGFVLDHLVFDTTTKFEISGDRDITPEEAIALSGLTPEGYRLWTEEFLPKIVNAQIQMAKASRLLNIDGKLECVTLNGSPVLTDFAFTPDENRLMVTTKLEGERIAIPTNKEIMRAIFREEGIYSAIDEAKRRAVKEGDINSWKQFVPLVLKERRINIEEVTEHAYSLMRNAIAEVANRTLGRTIFDVSPLETWIGKFVPYASRINQ